jgi:hypothetical protein
LTFYVSRAVNCVTDMEVKREIVFQNHSESTFPHLSRSFCRQGWSVSLFLILNAPAVRVFWSADADSVLRAPLRWRHNVFDLPRPVIGR